MKMVVAKPVAVVGLMAVFADTAYAQGAHDGSHPADVTLSRQELFYGIAHGAVLMGTVLLVGLVAFMALVWLPISRVSGEDAARLFGRGVLALFGLLVVAGLAEISLYAVRASGEPFGLGLLGQTLFDTRVGNIWLMRLGLALATVLVVAWAVRRAGPPYYWWVATGIGGVMLLTLTQLSHAAAEGRFLPFLADWLHVVAVSVWMGGLLGFPLLLLGPLRAVPTETRGKLVGRAVRRFSRAATLAVAVIVVTGIYASLVHVPSVEALIGTAYGRALIMKLGLAVFVLAIGAINLIDRGEGPFGRMVGAELILALGVFVATGFLTSLPPP